MSVFTTVTSKELSIWLQAYPLGELTDLQGIASGITNTNYFVTTSSGRYVLTLFERNTADELPYFIDLMTHLAERNIPCPHPVTSHDGGNLNKLNGKPAALVSCLSGRAVETPTALHCVQLGGMMAKMHVAGLSFPEYMENPRGAEWRVAMAVKVARFLGEEDHAMLGKELVFQSSFSTDHLPQGVIHADLFRDNVLFDGDRLSGIIDFYYACNDALLYDVAIAANDWCLAENGSLDGSRLEALLQAYHAVRPLTKGELAAWPGLLRTAAMRFWLSRLYDLHFPQAGEMTYAKDPEHFRHILAQHIKKQSTHG